MTLRGVGFGLALSILILAGRASADVPTGLNHQGLLLDQSGQPLDGKVDLQLKLWNHATSTASANRVYQETHIAVMVVDGVYSVTLGAGTSPSGPFSASLFSSPDIWLEVVVNGETMAPRQKLMAVGYSLQAQQCVNASTVQGSTVAQVVSQAQTSVPAANLTGQIANSLLSPSVTLLGPSIEGSDISDFTIESDDLASGSVTSGKIEINSIYDASINQNAYISGTKISPDFGTQNIQTTGWIGSSTPGQTLELRAGNERALRLIPDGLGLVSVLNGPTNSAAPGAYGVAIGGGVQNSAGDFATVAGGNGNRALGSDSTVGGGYLNSATESYSTVPGGRWNSAGGAYSFAAGFGAKVRSSAETFDSDGDEGTFIWADALVSDFQPFQSTGPNQFLIRAAGGVGIGTSTPQGVLQLGSAGDSSALRFGGANSRHHVISNRDLVLNTFDINAAPGTSMFELRRNTIKFDEFSASPVLLSVDDAGSLAISGNAFKPGGGSWSVPSDERLKKNLQPLDHALESLLDLHGITFEYKDPDAIHELHGERIGMTAQNVEAVFPDWVSEGADGYKRVTYRGFEALTVEALRELQAEIEKLRAENRDLRDQEAAELSRALDDNRELRESNRAMQLRVERLESALGLVAGN